MVQLMVDRDLPDVLRQLNGMIDFDYVADRLLKSLGVLEDDDDTVSSNATSSVVTETNTCEERVMLSTAPVAEKM